MPKKTKRQKMAADKRKTTHHLQEKTSHVEMNNSNKTSISHTQNQSVLQSPSSTEIFKKDLSKSLIISVAIILVEIVIYLAQNKVIPVTNLF